MATMMDDSEAFLTLVTRLRGLSATWRIRAAQQREYASHPEALNTTALSGMADANESRADELNAVIADIMAVLVRT